ncbi:hypothetical protein [Mesorhizobium sp.]|uniref:P-loop ATPase, Sll1717 family n=1 Tax=Mesorhizobium sp. TaxID=1871066 RepID=UPI000FE60A9C|nr:hypothetical protein [Mesorhizobium sp.]RWP68174.1 MAG: hypothetical protein EOR07_08140 [Mesorhizobium sp.]
MPKIVDILNLKGNPFEHYVAEQEPNIAEYAVKPPYFSAIDGRALNTSSFILFGDRGAGKSATRLTIFKELWKQKNQGKSVPLAVNMVDFSSVVNGKTLKDLSEATLVRDVAFFVIESLLTWLSSLEEDERNVYLEGQNDEEKALCYSLIRDFYMARPAAMRERSVHEAMVLLNQAFLSKSALWGSKQWGKIAGLIGIIGEVLTKTLGGKGEVAGPVKDILTESDDQSFDSVLVLRNLVRFAGIFDFSGVTLLIDKVDETSATNNSADQTAAMIHPLLARVQLMEVAGFGWIFFLWTAVKGVFEGPDRPVRLDKLGYATVSWDDKFFSLMLDKRTEYFSDKRFALAGFFPEDVDLPATLAHIVKVSMRSPREVIRIMDVIVREHDIVYGDFASPELLSPESVEMGLDVYVTDRIATIYGERLLAQIFRLNRTSFTNKDVQRVFRVGAQSARTRIQSWESAGIIKLVGTKAGEGGLGRPVNEYSVIDARIERVMQRQLITYDTPIVAEAEFDEVED